MPGPEWSRKELKKFLLENTDYYERTRRRIARSELAEDVPQHEIVEASITKYLSKNWDRIDKKTEELTDDICKKIIPGYFITYFLKQFAILSVFLIPPIIALSCYLALLWGEPAKNCDRVGLCVGSLVLLIVLFGASVFAILPERQRKL